MSRIRILTLSFTIFAVFLSLPAAVRCQEPERVNLCDLKKDPAAYDHKLIQVTDFVSHGFEDFTLFEPTCPDWPSIWLEYGGTSLSGTMYCCGVTNARSRSKELEVENIPIPLIGDDRFRDFDRLIQRTPDSMVHATIIGRFFAGRKREPPFDPGWGGYGHLGCCSLLAIQQILSADPHDRADLDYRAWPDEPRITAKSCGYRDLLPLEPYDSAIQAQRAAESGERGWAFEDPRRVASVSLAQLLKITESSIEGLKQTKSVQGRFVYEWRPKKKKARYMIVVSRPSWLSYYSKDPTRVAWVDTAAYRSSCGQENQVERVR